MSKRIKRITMLAFATAAALAATAAAAETYAVYTPPGTVTTYYYDPATDEYHYGAPLPSDPYVVEQSMPYYVVRPDDYYVDNSAVYYVEPPITVYGPRDQDTAITNDVVDTLAADNRIAGNIGVDTYRGETTLTGRVGTNGQRDIAATDAYSVDGVDRVNNRLHAAVGEF